jgi:hypothetical protein
VVLRLKRTRNPDMVSLERFDHFLHYMQARGVTVLLCGVRPELAKAIGNLRSRIGFLLTVSSQKKTRDFPRRSKQFAMFMIY